MTRVVRTILFTDSVGSTHLVTTSVTDAGAPSSTGTMTRPVASWPTREAVS